jgi:hypothetical protein
LENLDTEVNVNKAWETIWENIKISAKESQGYYELKNNKQWFDKGCSKLLDHLFNYEASMVFSFDSFRHLTVTSILQIKRHRTYCVYYFRLAF